MSEGTVRAILLMRNLLTAYEARLVELGEDIRDIQNLVFDPESD